MVTISTVSTRDYNYFPAARHGAVYDPLAVSMLQRAMQFKIIFGWEVEALQGAELTNTNPSVVCHKSEAAA